MSREISVNPTHSELMNDILASSRGITNTSGLNTKIRAMVCEVMELSPWRLSSILSESAKKSTSDIVHRAANYVIGKIEKRNDISPEEKQNVIDETKGLFGDFLNELQTEIMHEFVEVENFILTNTYMLDPGLFAEGFIRFQHYENVDYTDPERAQKVANSVDEAEKSVESKVHEVARLKKELEDLSQAEAKLDHLVEWLSKVLNTGLVHRAGQIREIADQVEKGVTILRSRLN